MPTPTPRPKKKVTFNTRSPTVKVYSPSPKKDSPIGRRSNAYVEPVTVPKPPPSSTPKKKARIYTSTSVQQGGSTVTRVLRYDENGDGYILYQKQKLYLN